MCLCTFFGVSYKRAPMKLNHLCQHFRSTVNHYYQSCPTETFFPQRWVFSSSSVGAFLIHFDPLHITRFIHYSNEKFSQWRQLLYFSILLVFPVLFSTVGTHNFACNSNGFFYLYESVAVVVVVAGAATFTLCIENSIWHFMQNWKITQREAKWSKLT